MPPVKGRVADGGGGLFILFLLAWRDLRPEFRDGLERRGSFGGDGHQVGGTPLLRRPWRPMWPQGRHDAWFGGGLDVSSTPHFRVMRVVATISNEIFGLLLGDGGAATLRPV
jgi:hypothetical protein